MSPDIPDMPDSVAALTEAMAAQDYILSEGLAVSLFLALRRQRPLFLEGEAGVGKTEVAKTLSSLLGRKLIRLQCYEGLDIAAAAYEWNYARQMMEIQSAGQGQLSSADLFTAENLIERPLLEALHADETGAPVLLIDELDRADEAFEAYLLEILSDWQVTIPEYGTVRASTPPIVIITSNRTREIHDALKRRCFYHWVDYPALVDEIAILKRRAPEAPAALSEQVVRFVHRLRNAGLFKAPGVAETIDWAQALVELDCVAIDPAKADSTMGVLLKYQDDIARITGTEAARILTEVQAEMAGSRTG
jgi:MoxR-like ATPase